MLRGKTDHPQSTSKALAQVECVFENCCEWQLQLNSAFRQFASGPGQTHSRRKLFAIDQNLKAQLAPALPCHSRPDKPQRSVALPGRPPLQASKPKSAPRSC